MTVTEFDLANIVAGASSFSERLSNRLLAIDTTQVHQQTESDKRLERWCQVVAEGNWEKFQKRLQWDGLDLDTARAIINSFPIEREQTLPNWAGTLKQIIQSACQWGLGNGQFQSSVNGCKLPIPTDSENPLPFEDLLLPVVHVARHKLLTHLDSPGLNPSYLPLKLLSEEAYLKLERSLIIALTNLCDRTLEEEFSNFRPFGHNLLNLMSIKTEIIPEKTHYNAFVQKLLQDGLLTFFQKYPVLAKFIAIRIDFWVEATAEFLQRLKADLTEIQRSFQPKQESNGELPVTQLGKVAGIQAGLSDSHQQGRCVIGITFESGQKLIYKPKDLELEVAYQQLLEWCYRQGLPLSFKVIKVLNRSDYGWVEYVEQLPIEDEAAAQRFYQRAGMLLCLLYMLNTTDCHYENLIANGEHLVLIDMETLMHHDPYDMEELPDRQIQTSANQLLVNSVLRSGLLPRWDFNKNKRTVYDVSGLGNVDADAALSDRVLKWKFVNTDNMHQVYETVTLPFAKNIPILNSVPLSPNDYLDEIVEGFRQMYGFLLQHREALLAENSPLTVFSEQQVRFVFRATKVYAVVLQSLLAPEYLQDGVDFSIELDILSRAFLTTENKPLPWQILHSELQAMEQLDIPLFGAKSDSDSLSIGVEQPLLGYLKSPCYNQVISRLQELGKHDLARQIGIIQGSFYARIARLSQSDRSEISETDPQLHSTHLTSEQFLAAARSIAEEIRDRAIKEASGDVYWIGLSFIPGAEKFQLQATDESLYNGNCGIALFLAALDALDNSSQFRELVLGTLQSTRRFLETAEGNLAQRWAKRIGIGGASGLGSVIYSLVKISHFIKEGALVEDALKAASLMTPESIAADRQLDVISGAAGAVLGLLTLYRETANPTVLDRAIACGEHLLCTRISFDGLPKAWKTIDDRPLTGFSHGAAGIACALLQLYSVTRDRAYLEAACEGIAYERHLFSPSVANWPDLRSHTQQNGQPTYTVNWCHGAAGIGLARLGSLSILETEAIYQDVEVALQTIQKHDLHSVDHLCCGNFSRIETLLVAAQKLARPELQEIARDQAARVVAKAAQTGAYQLFANLPNYVFNPSFFQGTAGIGYELLRLAYPAALPSVLLWE